MHPPPRPSRPVAHYVVDYDGEFHWLIRRSITGTELPIFPYTDPAIAQGWADRLNTHVRWEAI